MADLASDEAQRSADPAECVAYAPVPLLGSPSPVAQLLVIFGLIALGSLAFWSRQRLAGVPSACAFGPIGLIAIPLAILWLGGPFRLRLRNLRRASALREYEASRNRDGHGPARVALALFQLELDRQLFSWRKREGWTWHELTQAFGDNVLELPRTLADESRASALRAIVLPPPALEPEPIISGSHFSRRTSIIYFTSMALMVASLGISFLGRGSADELLRLLVWLPFLLLALAQLPAVRKRFPNLPFLLTWRETVVAGMGVVRDPKGRRWSAGNAMMILAAKTTHSSIGVLLVGPAGWLGFNFGNESDPEFIKLWQRWNHPHPRPELLE